MGNVDSFQLPFHHSRMLLRSMVHTSSFSDVYVHLFRIYFKVMLFSHVYIIVVLFTLLSLL